MDDTLAVPRLRFPGFLLTLLIAADCAGAEGPGWLAAVGRLEVPGQRWEAGERQYVREQCSATLVGTAAARSANLLVSAWHCLEHYGDLSKRIVFSVTTADGRVLTREALRVADGGGMYADWAVLRLTQPIAASDIRPLPLLRVAADPRRDIAMAGFVRDASGVDAQRRLALDADCSILGPTAQSVETDCAVTRGSSGGAVVQVSADGKAALCGVISEGDGVGISRYVPAHTFRHAVPESGY